MIGLYNGLLSGGLTPSVAWRTAFAIVPVPILLLVAAATLIWGTDHPAGKWSDRHKAIAHAPGVVDSDDEKPYASPDDGKDDTEKKGGLADIQVTVAPAQDQSLLSFFAQRTRY